MIKKPVQRTVLENGISLITESIPHVRSVSIGVWVKTGSRHESAPLNGVSHFVEHLLFKGTQNRSAREVAFAIDSLGGQLDAFTTREYTCYYARVMDEHLPQALALLSDLVLRPLLSPDDMEVERQVILEEIRMVEDSPEDYVHDMFVQTTWPGHALGRPILGSNESIASLTNRDLKAYFGRHYRPDNIVISAAGNLEHRQLQLLTQQHFNVSQSGKAADRKADHSTPPFRRHFTKKNKKLEQVHLCLGAKGIPYADKQRFAAYILNTLLGGGMSSRLFQKIREEHGLAYAIYSYIMSFRDTGIFTVYAATAPDNIKEVLRLIMEELRDMKENSLEETELRKSKEQLKGAFMLSLESTTSRMTSLAKYELYFGRHFTLDEILHQIEAVTAEQIQGLARSFFEGDNTSLTLLGTKASTKLSGDFLR